MSEQAEPLFLAHLDHIDKKTSNKERFRWQSMSKTLHPINTQTKFG